jgi:hypothetical protein
LTEENVRTILTIYRAFEIDDNESEEAVRYKTLKLDQVKLNISSIGMKKELIEGKKYQVAFFSQNAISLTEDLQIVLRFSGNVTQIHKTFDFVHATNYFTFEEGLVTNVAALESILTKSLRYQGSLYPLTCNTYEEIHTTWLDRKRGEILKMLFQVSELDLKHRGARRAAYRS